MAESQSGCIAAAARAPSEPGASAQTSMTGSDSPAKLRTVEGYLDRVDGRLVSSCCGNDLDGSAMTSLSACLDHRVLDNARIEAFKNPLLDYRGGLVLIDPKDSKLRQTRYWKPFDNFDPDAPVESHLDGEFIYAGPIYHHFGHFMAEMVHRIVQSKKLFSSGNWIFSDIAANDQKTYDYLPSWIKAILEFLEVESRSVTIIGKNTAVSRVSVVEQGSDFGGGPKPGYLSDLLEFSERRLQTLRHSDAPIPKVYVSRGGVRHGGAFLGESYIENHLEREGFFIFRPEQYTPSKQMDVYRKAEVLVFPEGSACHGTELLGQSALNRCYFISRRETHFEIFRRVLSPRSKEFKSLVQSMPVGSIAANPSTKEPYMHMGASLFDIGALIHFFRENEIALMNNVNSRDYFDAAEADLMKYFEFFVTSRPNLVDNSAFPQIIRVFSDLKKHGNVQN
jgi:hypothetical protein